jgi:transposase
VLTPYIPYLIRLWHERGAQTDSVQLWREIQALGYTHSSRTVCRVITRLRRATDAGLPPASQGSPYTRPQGPSARAVSFAVICPAATRSVEARTYIDQLCRADPGIASVYTLIQAFLALVQERRGHTLEAWIAETADSRIAELARFASGLRDDLPAITAGLTLEWNHGVTEGHVHRLKLVKRQGYGRAGFALLRQRVLRVA